MKELDVVMRKYKALQLQLMGVRGSIPPSMSRDISTKELITTLQNWDPRQRKVGIIIYEQSEDSLRSFFLTNEGIQLKSAVATTKLKLQQLEQSLKRVMGAELSLDSLGKRGVSITSLPKKQSEAAQYTRQLSNILLPAEFPIRKLDHLVIVPTNNIGALPFSMFPLDSTTFLIDKMSYSIVPTINEFVCATEYHRKKLAANHYQLSPVEAMDAEVMWDSTEKVLILANPTFHDKRFEKSELPGAEDEVLMVQKYFPNAIVLKNKEASKNNLLREIYDPAILYFATHGVASVKEPVFNNGLYLAGDKASENFWTYNEIINLGNKRPLNAELVILSACQTGLGYARGAGIVSLARAFQISGADNVVMSLWNISDNKTPELMDLFFKYLRQPLLFQPFGAMQQAIIEFKKVNKNPVYWAPFSIYGVPY